MPEYTVMLMRQASKDLEESRRAGYGDKADHVLMPLSENPFASPPSFKELSGKHRGFHFRRLNRTGRVVYRVGDGEGGEAVMVARMRTHCGGDAPARSHVEPAASLDQRGLGVGGDHSQGGRTISSIGVRCRLLQRGRSDTNENN